MQLQGRVIAVLPERSGTSARTGSEWKSQSFVIETHENYPHKMVFDVFGADKLQSFNIQLNQEILVSFDIDAHEYNGRWFNNIRAFAVQQVDPNTVEAAGVQPVQQAGVIGAAPANGAQAPFPQQPEASGSADDLPF